MILFLSQLRLSIAMQKQLLLALAITGLVSCGGNYQAPVSDQGERQVTRSPEIVQSSNQSSSVIVERSRAGNSSSGVPVSGRQARPVEINSPPVRANPPVEVSRRPISAQTRPDNPGSHRVSAGDTLYSIAFQYDLDFRSLAIANNLRAPYTIFVDQQINLAVADLSESSAGSAINSGVGTAVTNNGVARSQGDTARPRGVLRQPIQSNNRAPTWAWPHQGRVIRGFRDGDNKGLDIQGRTGDSVLAAGSGDVVYSGRGVQGSGNLIIIRHSDRYLSAYAHNSVMLVGEGSRVATGDKIAEVGTSPAGEPMLHFEIRLDGKPVDPSELLPGR